MWYLLADTLSTTLPFVGSGLACERVFRLTHVQDGTNDSSETGILGAFRQGGHLAVGFDADTTGDFGDPIWKRIVANGGKAEAGLYLERIALSDGLRHKIDGTVQENAGELMLG